MENHNLRRQYTLLNRRLDNSLQILERIRERDDNFYRVMLQMDPVASTRRLSGLDNILTTRDSEEMNDAEIVRQISQQMDLMERQLVAQVQSFDQLRDSLSKEKEKMKFIPSIMPIGENHFTLASGFGHRRDLITGNPKYHEGIDMAASMGSAVRATADGTVVASGRQAGYGNCVEINHGYNYLSRYAHLSEVMVKTGDSVKRGDLIGRVGSSGVSTAPHLHYEVRFKGEPQNPVNYFFMDLSPDKYADMIQRAENSGHLMD